MKSWLQDNDLEINWTYNVGKYVVIERFIRALKNKIYKYMSSLSKNVYVNKLDDIVNWYNNTGSTMKMKPADVKASTYIDFNVENNDADPKFKVGGHLRISKHKSIFVKGYAPNWSEEVFVIEKVKNTLLWKYLIEDLNKKEIVGMF